MTALSDALAVAQARAAVLSAAASYPPGVMRDTYEAVPPEGERDIEISQSGSTRRSREAYRDA